MKFSIIIATLNNEQTIEKTILSLKVQKFKDFEIIFVDGGSKDRTLKIIADHHLKNIRVINQVHRGVYNAFNLGVEFKEGEGPIFNNPIRNVDAINNLPTFNAQDLSYVYKCVSNIRRALPADLPLIGFCGSPWTLAAYSIEGGSSKDFLFTKNFIGENPQKTQELLSLYTNACFEYLREQVIAGIDAIQIFDSWAGLLNKEDYEIYSLYYINDLVRQLKEDSITANIPVILFARQPQGGIEQLSVCKPDCISLYWDESIDNSIDILKGKIAIQGSLNPQILKEDNSIIYDEVKSMLNKFSNYPGYIFNLGHGLTPDIDPDKVKFLTDTIREL